MQTSTGTIVTLALALIVSFSDHAHARGGLGGFHAQGYHIGGVGVPYGGVSMGSAAAMHTGIGYGRMHFHPSVGYYHPATQPYHYNLGGVGGFRYNQSYANPYSYHNPYMYHPNSTPYHVPFTPPF